MIKVYVFLVSELLLSFIWLYIREFIVETNACLLVEE